MLSWKAGTVEARQGSSGADREDQASVRSYGGCCKHSWAQCTPGAGCVDRGEAAERSTAYWRVGTQ